MKWTFKEPLQIDSIFYFDYSYDLINPQEPTASGGAPGFIVNEEGKIEIVSWE